MGGVDTNRKRTNTDGEGETRGRVEHQRERHNWVMNVICTTNEACQVLLRDDYSMNLPVQARNGPSARERAPSERNIPITFPFSSPSPAINKLKQ